MLPKGLPGFALKKKGNSYEIFISNIDMKAKSAEKIENLDYSFKDGTFLIKFGGMVKVKPVQGGSMEYLTTMASPGNSLPGKNKIDSRRL